MKWNLTAKLVLAFTLTGLVLVAAMLIGTRLSFERGFLDYLSQVELKQLDPLAEALQDSYAQYGDWHLLRGNHQNWMRHLAYVSLNKASRPTALPSAIADFFTRPQAGMHFRPPHILGANGPADPPDERRPRGEAPPPPPPPAGDPSALSFRLRLLDTNQEALIGPPDSSGEPILRPLFFQNMIVGYLSLTPLPWPEDELVQAFSRQQQTTLFVIALLALLLALTVAIPFGHRLVKPIRKLAQGAAQLTRGNFDIHLDQHYSDELGQLTRDFNTLARTLEKDKALRRHAMADISHELRTPLAVLRAEIEAMQDGIRNNDEKQLQILHDNVSGLSHLVDDLHELALSDVGALSYHKQEIDLSNVILATIQSMNAEFTSKNIALVHDIEPNIRLNADARRMRQVMANILKNSFRYTNSNGRTEISAQSNNNQATIIVKDSAPGVDNADLPHLFERFYRTESSRSRTTGGSGLGLAISKNIIEAHQGSIVLKSASLGGLEVIIKLPLP